MSINTEGIIEKSGEALTKVSTTERAAFIFTMIFSIISIVGTVIFFINNINDIVKTYNNAIADQRREFLQTIREFR